MQIKPFSNIVFDNFPKNSEAKTFCIFNDTNSDIIEISVTKDEARILLLILAHLTKNNLEDIATSSYFDYYDNLKSVLFGIIIGKGSRQLNPSDNFKQVIEKNPNILMLLRQILKYNKHRGFLFNSRYTSRVQLIKDKLLDISLDQFHSRITNGSGLFGFNKVRYTSTFTDELSQVLDVSINKNFLIETTKPIAQTTLQLLSIFDKQDLKKISLVKEDRTEIINLILLSKIKTAVDREYYKNTWESRDQDSKKAIINLLSMIVDENQHRYYSTKKYTARVELIIESLQNIVNKTKVLLKVINHENNIFRYLLSRVRKIIRDVDQIRCEEFSDHIRKIIHGVNGHADAGEKFLNYIGIVQLELEGKLNTANKSYKFQDIDAANKQLNLVSQNHNKAKDEIENIISIFSDINLLKRFIDIYRSLQDHSKVYLINYYEYVMTYYNKYFYREFNPFSNKFEGESIKSEKNIKLFEDTSKYISYGRTLFGENKKYAVFIKDVGIDDHDAIEQKGYNYPQVNESNINNKDYIGTNANN